MMKGTFTITYLFVGSRKSRLESSEKYAKDFFYSYDYFKNKYPSTEIIEFNDVISYSKLIKRLVKYLDKIIRKLIKFPFFMHEIVNLKNISRIINTDVLVITNDRIGFSILPIIFLKKFKSHKYISTNVFVLGLFANLGTNSIQRFFQRKILNLYFSAYDNFLFIGKSEYELALAYANKYSNKFHYIPFCVDTNFWTSSNKKKDNDILFIGNDGNRDFQKAVEITKILKNNNFIFVTNNIFERDVSEANVKLIAGHWNYNLLTDSQIRDFYDRSYLTIIPLKDSIQPSGQSVALQSMSMGTPALISNTVGFWDRSHFKNEDHIFFIDKNASSSEWSEKVSEILNDNKLLAGVSDNGHKLIQENFNLKKFHLEIEKIMKI